MKDGLKQILLSQKFELIIEAGDGKEALEKLKESVNKPDLIFSDLEMPNMNGIEFVRELRNRKYSTKVIMVTSISDKGKVAELINLGISGYIVKPFERETLLVKLAQILGRESSMPKYIDS